MLSSRLPHRSAMLSQPACCFGPSQAGPEMKLASLCGHQRVEECESDGQFRVDFLILTPRPVWRKLKQTKGTKKFFSRSEKVFAWEEACICVGQLRTAAGSQGTDRSKTCQLLTLVSL